MPEVSSEASARQSGTRRRGLALETAILAATLQELASVGYSALTMEGVAIAAGTGKAALYRRWSKLDDLVADALRSALPDPGNITLTGDTRADLLSVLTCIRDAIARSHGTVFQAGRDGTAGAGGMMHSVVGQRVMDPCLALVNEVLRRGVSTGELRPGAEGPLVATVGPAMIVHYVVHTAPVAPDSYLESVVNEILIPLTAAARPA
jgi:AcrR family transcriptional regulator